MATELGSAYISVGLGTNKLGPEIKKAFAGIDGVAGSAGESAGKSFQGKFSGFMKSATIPALAAGGGLLAFAKNVGDLAATAEQNMGAVESVFKGAAGEVAAFAAGSAKNLGISSSEYNSFASLIGSQFKNAGVPLEDLAGKTNDLVTKGADLASMFGGTTSDAVAALSSALKGEMDPIEAYGISLNEAAIKGKLAELGLSGLEGAAGQAAKTQAVLALVSQQSADATGNFSKEATTAAGAQQIANAQWENARATLGESLLPIMSQLAGTLSVVAGWVKENSALVIGLAIGVGTLAGAVLLINGGLAVYSAYTAVIPAALAAWSGAQWLLNAAMTANPIGLIVVGIVLLVAALVSAYNSVGWFKDGVNAAFAVISAAAGDMATWVGGAIGNVTSFFQDLPGKILAALGNMGTLLLDSGKSLIQGFLDGIGKIDIGAAVGGVLESIRDFFPFSPAKKGPFSGRGYTTYSGAALASDFADSIAGQQGKVAAAAATINGAAALSGSMVSANASFAGDPLATSASGATVNIHPAPGMSEETIGRVAANSLNYQLRMA